MFFKHLFMFDTVQWAIIFCGFRVQLPQTVCQFLSFIILIVASEVNIPDRGTLSDKLKR